MSKNISEPGKIFYFGLSLGFEVFFAFLDVIDWFNKVPRVL